MRDTRGVLMKCTGLRGGHGALLEGEWQRIIEENGKSTGRGRHRLRPGGISMPGGRMQEPRDTPDCFFFLFLVIGPNLASHPVRAG